MYDFFLQIISFVFFLKSRYFYLRSLFSEIFANQQVDDLITNSQITVTKRNKNDK